VVCSMSCLSARSTMAAPSAGEMKDFARDRDIRSLGHRSSGPWNFCFSRSKHRVLGESVMVVEIGFQKESSDIRVVNIRYHGIYQQRSTTWFLKGIGQNCNLLFLYFLPQFR